MISLEKLREQREHFNPPPKPAPKARPEPVKRPSFHCLMCGTGPLSHPNRTGLCRLCVAQVGFRTRSRYREIHQQRVAGWLRLFEAGRAA